MYNLVSFVLSFIKNWYARLSLCKNSGALQWDDTAPVGRAPPQGDTPERKHDTMWIVRYIKLSVARGYIPRIKDFWLGSTWSCSCTEKNETNKRCGRDARLRWSEGETRRKEVGEDETKRSKKVFSSFVEAHLPYLHRPLSSYFFFSFHFFLLSIPAFFLTSHHLLLPFTTFFLLCLVSSGAFFVCASSRNILKLEPSSEAAAKGLTLCGSNRLLTYCFYWWSRVQWNLPGCLLYSNK